jgi:hypothetical protein
MRASRRYRLLVISVISEPVASARRGSPMPPLSARVWYFRSMALRRVKPYLRSR